MRTEILRIQGLCAGRVFGCDLQQIHMNLYQGEVLGIVGLHDSGKSFLFDCIMGKGQASQGRIFLYEEPQDAQSWNPSDKIFRIQENSALVDTCSVMENIFVIRRQKKRKFLIPWKALRLQAAACLQEFNIEVEIDSPVAKLTRVERHIVEIVKAYISGAKLILIDDVLMPYLPGDYEKLYNAITRLQEKGLTFMISGCQLENLQRLTERCLFMVNGKTVKMIENVRRHQVDEMKILMGSTGRSKEVSRVLKCGSKVLRDVVFEARDIQIREGEIVVIVDFFHQWIPHLIEDIQADKERKSIYIADFLESNYMIGSLTFRDNLCLAAYKRISAFGFLHPGKVKAIERMFLERYEMKGNHAGREWDRLSFWEKMAVYLERIKLQKWEVMFCLNMENVMSYELEEMVKEQLKDMVCGGKAVCICAASFEKFADLADYFLVVTEQKQIQKFTYKQLREYFEI